MALLLNLKGMVKNEHGHLQGPSSRHSQLVSEGESNSLVPHQGTQQLPSDSKGAAGLEGALCTPWPPFKVSEDSSHLVDKKELSVDTSLPSEMHWS